MAATGYTPIYLYYSSTATNQPSAGNLGYGELALNITDKNLFFKDNTNAVNTIPLRQASGSSNGWLSSTDWTTFNGKAPAVTYTTSYIPYGQGTTTPALSSSLQFNGSQFSVNQTTLNEGGITPAAWVKQSSDVNFKGLAIRDAGAGGEVLHTGYDGTKFVTTVTYLNAGGAYKAYAISVNGNETVNFDTSLNLNVNYGNVVIGTSGKGIDFSATAGTGTSELLADYEEGTFTPTDQSGAGLTFVASYGVYTKVGRQVFCQMSITYPVTASAANVTLGGLPYTINNGSSSSGRSGGYISATDSVAQGVIQLESTATFRIYTTGFTQATNANLSGTTLYMVCSYIT